MESPTPNPPHSPQGPGPEAKSGKNGCLIAAIVIGVVLVLSFGGIGVCTYVVMQDPEMSEALDMVMGAVTAPGREELQEAGCIFAVVIDPERLNALGGETEPSDNENDSVGLSSPMITCSAEPGKEPVTCETLARVYAKAVPDAAETLMVMVIVEDPDKPFCSGIYDHQGVRLGPIPGMDSEVE